MKLLPLSLLAGATLLAAPSLQAETILQLKVDGIPGEAAQGAIEVVSYQAGVAQRALGNVAGGGASASKSDFKPLTIFKSVDLSTPGLLMACATGKHIASATLTISKRQDGGSSNLSELFRIVLNDVVVASVNENSDTTDGFGNFLETVTFSYSKIQFVFTPQTPGGGTGTEKKFSWDLIKNR